MMTIEDAMKAIEAAINCPDVAISETIRMIQEDAYQSGYNKGHDDAEYEQGFQQ